MYIYIYIYTHLYMYIHTYIYTCIFMHTHLCIYIYINTYICIYVYACVSIHSHLTTRRKSAVTDLHIPAVRDSPAQSYSRVDPKSASHRGAGRKLLECTVGASIITIRRLLGALCFFTPQTLKPPLGAPGAYFGSHGGFWGHL